MLSPSPDRHLTFTNRDECPHVHCFGSCPVQLLLLGVGIHNLLSGGMLTWSTVLAIGFTHLMQTHEVDFCQASHSPPMCLTQRIPLLQTCTFSVIWRIPATKLARLCKKQFKYSPPRQLQAHPEPQRPGLPKRKPVLRVYELRTPCVF